MVFKTPQGGGLKRLAQSCKRSGHGHSARRLLQVVQGQLHQGTEADIQRGFIRAETVAYEDFMASGTMAKAKEKGKVRLEGKDYVVQDGDILHFRFNV